MSIRALIVAFLLLADPVAAQGPRTLSEAIAVEVRPGWREADGRHVAGLAFRLAPGWKTYWRAPGALGISPRADWRGSRNARAVAPVWPRPRVLRQPGGQAFGYASDFILPLVVRPRDPAVPVRLRGRLDLGVCAEICVPVRLQVEAVLPLGGEPDPTIRAALADRPATAPGSARCRVAPAATGVRLTVELPAPPLGGAEAVAVELADADLWVGDAATTRRGGVLRAEVAVMSRSHGPVALDRDGIRLTGIGRDRAVEAVGCVAD